MLLHNAGQVRELVLSKVLPSPKAYLELQECRLLLSGDDTMVDVEMGNRKNQRMIETVKVSLGEALTPQAVRKSWLNSTYAIIFAVVTTIVLVLCVWLSYR